MTSGPAALVAALAGAAVLMALPPARARTPPARSGVAPVAVVEQDQAGRLLRHRLLLALVAGAGVGTGLGAAGWGGATAPVAGLAVGVGCWVAAGRAEPAGRRAREAQVRREAPHVVALFAAALRAGAAPAPALVLVAHALPGPATEASRSVAARLDLGTDPVVAWAALADEPGLAPWGRAMARAHESGASVVEAVDRLALELAESARAEVEDRARTVGVRAALPLGLCLLPAFLLVGIVPLVAGLLGSLW